MATKPPTHRAPGSTGNRQQQRRAYDQQRDKLEWRRWYKTAAWQERRQQQLDAQPHCANCLRYGRLTKATVADHIDPHRGDYDRFWTGRLQSLCDETPWRCHSSVKQRQEGIRSG